jgi:hypothetical protein
MALKQDKLTKKNKIPGEAEMEIWRIRGRRNACSVEEKNPEKGGRLKTEGRTQRFV